MKSKNRLDALPSEVLMEIFKKVPNKMPLQLTCVVFYEVIYQLEARKFRLVVKDVRDSRACS